MIKKVISSMMVCFLFFLSVSISFAADDIKILSLDKARSLARENAESTKIYKELVEKYKAELKIKEQGLGEKYNEVDSEGVETEKYRNGSLDFDYKNTIEEYENQIENYQDINENKAISKYFAILLKQLEKEKKSYEIELVLMDISISRTKLENGMTLEVELSEQLQKQMALENDLLALQNDIEVLYEELNDCIGIDKKSIYALDSSSLITKVVEQDITLYTPTSSIEIAKKESKTIKDAKENLEEKKKQLENYSKLYPKGTKEYEAKEKELDIEDLTKDIDKQKDVLYFDLEASYLDMVNAFAKLAILNDDIDFVKYESSIDDVYYSTGSISKRDYIERRISSNQIKEDYTVSMLDLYQQILEFEKMFGLEKNK